MSDRPTMQVVMLPWKNAQQPMAEVIRWGNFPGYGQTLLKHNNAIPWVLEWVGSQVSQWHPLDEALLQRAFMAHDQGEPLTGGDEHHDAKTFDKDVREWVAFMEQTAALPEPMRSRVQTAFALQFVRKQEHPAAPWPYPLQSLVAELRIKYPIEAVVFDFVERLDYLFTALDGYFKQVRNGKEGMLEHCFRNQAPKLDAMVFELPALGTVWDIHLRVWLDQLAQKDARKEYQRLHLS